MQFSKRETSILKGMAIALLLIHHGFDPIKGDYTGAAQMLVQNTMSVGKLCVAIFALLSGYGMYCSFTRKRESGAQKSIWRFTLGHIAKIYLVFWLCSLTAILIVSVMKGSLGAIYPEHPFRYLLLDVLGVSYLTGTPKLVNSWWYVTAVLIYYCLFPFLYMAVRRLKSLNYAVIAVLTAVTLTYPGMTSIKVYGCCFIYGMIFAERDVFNRILNSFEKTKTQSLVKGAACFLLFIGMCLFRQKFLAGTRLEYYCDWMIAFVLILWVNECSCHIRRSRAELFEIVGRYSFEIYLIHGMFLKHFGKLMFSSFNCITVLIRLFLVSFAAAFVLKLVEDTVRRKWKKRKEIFGR